jgi:hypothetical protein
VKYDSEAFKKNHFYNYDKKTGRVECINYETGRVVAYAEKVNSPLVSVDEAYVHVQTPCVYSEHMAQTICELIAGGASISAICAMDGFPSYSQLARWRVRYPDFGREYDVARSMRAEVMHDRILETIGESIDADDVAVAKLEFDKLKYLASVNDPDRFGNRVKHSGDKDQPLQFIIDTGIRREGYEQDTGEGTNGQGLCGYSSTEPCDGGEVVGDDSSVKEGDGGVEGAEG